MRWVTSDPGCCIRHARQKMSRRLRRWISTRKHWGVMESNRKPRHNKWVTGWATIYTTLIWKGASLAALCGGYSLLTSRSREQQERFAYSWRMESVQKKGKHARQRDEARTQHSAFSQLLLSSLLIACPNAIRFPSGAST